MVELRFSETQSHLRGQLAAAKGNPCILRNDPVMLDALEGLGNREFGRLHRAFSAGWREGTRMASDLRTKGWL